MVFYLYSPPPLLFLQHIKFKIFQFLFFSCLICYFNITEEKKKKKISVLIFCYCIPKILVPSPLFHKLEYLNAVSTKIKSCILNYNYYNSFFKILFYIFIFFFGGGGDEGLVFDLLKVHNFYVMNLYKSWIRKDTHMVIFT